MSKPSKIIRWAYYGPNNYTHYEEMTLGQDYSMRRMSGRVLVCRFIKVTPKGFNLLDLSTSRCVCRRHFYTREFSGDKEIPRDRTTFVVGLPGWIMVQKVEKEGVL